MWLASRSSSSAQPRTACARGVLRQRESASKAPQNASACPITVSPAMDSATCIARAGGSVSSRRSTPRCW
jgi:hypothetical protein